MPTYLYRVLASCALAVVVACASGKPGGTGDDAGTDAVPVDGHTGAAFGEACADDLDCASLVCEDVGDGNRVCTRTCDFDCPDGYACRTVSHDGTDLRVCVLAGPNLCDTCATDEDCGDDGDLCVQLTAGKFCAVDCAADPTVCAVGFTCQNVVSVDERPRRQCLPVNGVCCVDADNDRHGVGDGCTGGDCDDADPAVYEGNRETCDGRDNDCVGGVDDNPLDCDAAMCELGALGYFERAGDVCAGAGGCQQQPAALCGLYTCDGGGEAGDRCATACDGEADGKCIPAAHCDASVCLADLGNGQACDEASDCTSGHCQNGFRRRLLRGGRGLPDVRHVLAGVRHARHLPGQPRRRGVQRRLRVYDAKRRARRQRLHHVDGGQRVRLVAAGDLRRRHHPDRAELPDDVYDLGRV